MTGSPVTENPSALIIEDHESMAEVFNVRLFVQTSTRGVKPPADPNSE
jgi:hypothetical protein